MLYHYYYRLRLACRRHIILSASWSRRRTYIWCFTRGCLFHFGLATQFGRLKNLLSLSRRPQTRTARKKIAKASNLNTVNVPPIGMERLLVLCYCDLRFSSYWNGKHYWNSYCDFFRPCEIGDKSAKVRRNFKDWNGRKFAKAQLRVPTATKPYSDKNIGIHYCDFFSPHAK